MAKIDWSGNDEHLTPALMKTYFGEDETEGHNHDGTDDDGSCPNIDLTSGVTGVIPNANLIVTGSVDVKSTDTYFDTEQTSTWYYTIIGNMVFMRTVLLEGTLTSETGYIKIEAVTAWPAAIVALNANLSGCLVISTNLVVMGGFTPPIATDGAMDFYCADVASPAAPIDIDIDLFLSVKGVVAQNLMWMTS